MSKVAVSACLWGKKCRYDGKSRLEKGLKEELGEKEVVLFCPEEALLGVPRETIDIIEGRAMGSETKKDYTEALQKEAQKFIEQNPDIEAFYFKSKSPSCAIKSARVYDKKGNLINSSGTGIFAQEMKKHYKSAQFYEKEGK